MCVSYNHSYSTYSNKKYVLSVNCIGFQITQIIVQYNIGSRCVIILKIDFGLIEDL